MGQYASDLLLYLNAYEPRDAAAFNDKLSLLTDIINTTVSAPSWKMFGAGVYLANYKFANDRSQEAIDMLRTMINNAKVLTGDRTMPFVANMALSMAMFAERARSGIDYVKRMYTDAITAYSEAGMQKHTPVLCYAQYLFGLGDYSEVSRLLSGLLSDPALKANRADEAFVRLFLGFSMIACSSADGSVKDVDSVHKLFSEAIPVFMSGDVAVTPITVEGYRYISGYYRFFGHEDLSGQALGADGRLPIVYALRWTWSTWIFSTNCSVIISAMDVIVKLSSLTRNIWQSSSRWAWKTPDSTSRHCGTVF